MNPNPNATLPIPFHTRPPLAPPLRVPRIAIFETETRSPAVRAARESTVRKVAEKHGLDLSDPDARGRTKRSRLDEAVPLPDRSMDENERKKRCYERKLMQNRTSAEVSRDRNRVYVTELERGLEKMERDRNEREAELYALKVQLGELLASRTLEVRGGSTIEQVEEAPQMENQMSSVTEPDDAPPAAQEQVQQQDDNALPLDEVAWMKLNSVINDMGGHDFAAALAALEENGTKPDFSGSVWASTRAA